MPGLLIKNLPEKLHARLKERAKRNRRSMSAEVIVILERALGARTLPSLEEIRRIRVRPRKPITGEMVDEAKKYGRR